MWHSCINSQPLSPVPSARGAAVRTSFPTFDFFEGVDVLGELPKEFSHGAMELALRYSSLKKGIITLRAMLRYTDDEGWSCVSKARLAADTDVSIRTVQRHWEAARAAGYLTSFDYPESMRRTSDHWLKWPELHVQPDPAVSGLIEAMERYLRDLVEPPLDSVDPPPF